MIVTRIHGGLGNQLFEFAAGYALARRLGVPHKVDLGTFVHERERDFGLASLQIPFEVASAEEIRALAPQWGPWWKNKYILWSHRMTPFARCRWVKETTFDYDKRLLDVRSPAYLDGWWQSEKYFAGVGGEIRNMYSPKKAPTPRSEELAKALKGQATVAVHVRRGDYIANDDASQFHGTCSTGYYEDAISRMQHEVPEAMFCVFSDDPDWARGNLKFPARTEFVSAKGPLGVAEDFFLLCNCRHFVIANSTFSWWPAWIADSPGQHVIAPSRWFRGFEVNLADRFPADWELLDK
jgi:Glycosyl transferase family 11